MENNDLKSLYNWEPSEMANISRKLPTHSFQVYCSFIHILFIYYIILSILLSYLNATSNWFRKMCCVDISNRSNVSGK